MKKLIIIFAIGLFVFPSSAEKIGFAVGEVAPQISVKDIKGQPFNLYTQLKEKPVVLVFYRGGWCPYCNLQLRKMQKELAGELEQRALIVAISVDKVSEAVKTEKQEKLGMTLISDPMAEILKAYKLQFKVPEELVKTYKTKYKIDLERSSGQKHHIISIPAVYVVAKDKKITYAFAERDYKLRANNLEILKAVKGL